MALPECEYIQLDFFGLLPGAPGGRALRDRRGADYFARLARTAAGKQTPEIRQAIHEKANAERRRRLNSLPRTVAYVELDELVVERIIPWWPHQKNRQRRKRPVFVRIEMERVALNKGVDLP